MAVCKTLIYPKDKETLLKNSVPVPALSRQTRRLIEDLKDALIVHRNGIGLAAPQIGVHFRVVIVRLGSRTEWDSEAGPPTALVNPEISEAGDERDDYDGCLSLPGLFGVNIRPHYLQVKGLNESGGLLEHVFKGFDAVLLHHEIDHLNGVLFIDRIKSVDDMYLVRMESNGKLVRVPVSGEVPT
jgi:peptide deformylase